MRWYLLIGRILIGGVFAYIAAKGLTEPGAASAGIMSTTFPYAEYGAPAVYTLFGLAAASILLGLASRWGLRMAALALILCAFSRMFGPNGAEWTLAWSAGTLGALIALMALPAPWPVSVDEWIANDHNDWGWPWNGARVREPIGSLVRAVRSLVPALGTSVRALTRAARPSQATAQSDSQGRELVVQRSVRVVGGGKVVIRSVRGYIQTSGLEYFSRQGL